MYVKVGTVKHDGKNILLHGPGKPVFTGQRVLPVDEALKHLAFYYPIIPEFYPQPDVGARSYRYFGYLDLDMDMDNIISGKEPLFAGTNPKTYDKREQLKQELSKFLQDNSTEDKSMTFEELCEHVPALQRVCDTTRAVVNDLKYANKRLDYVLPFFTGLKGTRVLWIDKTLWRAMNPERRDAGDAGVDLLKEYFSESTVEALKNVEFDASVYGKGKGLKPDMLPHPYSGIAPLPLFDDESGLFSVDFELTRTPIPELTERLTGFWKHIMLNVDTEAKPLITGIVKYIFKSERREARVRRLGRVSSSSNTNKKRRKLSPIESRIEGLISLAVPNATIHQVKDECSFSGSYLVTLTADHTYCHISNCNHSRNKMYYIVDTVRGRVKQGCHSARCSCNGLASVFPKAAHLTADDAMFIEYQIDRSDLGLAEIFQLLVGDDIRIVDAKRGDCYIWNDRTKLWEDRPGIFCQNMISYKLTPVLESLLNDLYAEQVDINRELDELNNELKALKKKKKKEREYIAEQLKEIGIEKEACDEKVKTFVLTIKDLLKTSRISSAFTQVRTLLYDPDFAATVNKIPHLFPVSNRQVVDLRTGSVEKRSKEHRFTFESPVTYNGNLHMPTPHADTFFRSVMSQDEQMLEYFRTQLGYCLTGETRSRCFFIWWGALGLNGKGTVAALLKTIMVKFFAQLKKEAAIECSGKTTAGAATPHLVPLIDARLAMVSETGADDKLSEDLVKTWTGNDPLPIRQLFGEQQDVVTQAKLIIQTNNKPVSSGQNAVKDRTQFVHFSARFTKDGAGANETKSDPELIDSLQTKYLPEVFVFLLKGCVRWYKEGLVIPKIVRDHTADYFQENDVVQRWLDANTVQEPVAKTSRSELYSDFQSWCQSHAEHCNSANEFYSLLEIKNYKIGKGGQRLVTGLILKEDD
jgi:P4 family phage/plasmid primase-like protien